MTNQSLDKAVKESWIVIITKDLKTDRELVFEVHLKKVMKWFHVYWLYITKMKIMLKLLLTL